MGRAPCCDKTRVKKGPWSLEEDVLLRNYILRFGNGGNWITLPQKVGLNRCGKSCRLRWLNYLRPDIKHGGFTEEEDLIIYNLYSSLGSRWSVIASNLPGRTDNDVKNYWHTKLKKKISRDKFNNIIVPNATGTSTITSVTTDSKNIISSFDTSLNSVSTTLDVNDNFWQNQDKFPLINPGHDEMITIEESYSTTNTATTTTGYEISRASSSSSSVNSQQISYAFTSLISNGQQEDDFWMDLLSESFDNDIIGTDYFQLEMKINEIASLLDA